MKKLFFTLFIITLPFQLASCYKLLKYLCEPEALLPIAIISLIVYFFGSLAFIINHVEEKE